VVEETPTSMDGGLKETRARGNGGKSNSEGNGEWDQAAGVYYLATLGANAPRCGNG
jgi:hypothetical protein